jgi:hypothetical protein
MMRKQNLFYPHLEARVTDFADDDGCEESVPLGLSVGLWFVFDNSQADH